MIIELLSLLAAFLAAGKANILDKYEGQITSTVSESIRKQLAKLQKLGKHQVSWILVSVFLVIFSIFLFLNVSKKCF